MRGFCPHFREVMDLEDCFFCYFKRVKDMRVCPECGYREPPIWRQTFRRLYTEYCHIDDLTLWNPTLESDLREKKYVFLKGVKYRLKSDGYVQRIDGFLCANPDPTNPSISEPNKEKHKARILGRKRNQKELCLT